MCHQSKNRDPVFLPKFSEFCIKYGMANTKCRTKITQYQFIISYNSIIQKLLQTKKITERHWGWLHVKFQVY